MAHCSRNSIAMQVGCFRGTKTSRVFPQLFSITVLVRLQATCCVAYFHHPGELHHWQFYREKAEVMVWITKLSFPTCGHG